MRLSKTPCLFLGSLACQPARIQCPIAADSEAAQPGWLHHLALVRASRWAMALPLCVMMAMPMVAALNHHNTHSF